MVWIGLGCLVAFVMIVMWQASVAEAERKARQMLEDEQTEERAARKAAIKAARPLLEPPTLPGFADIGRVVATLEVEFDELQSFSDIERWDEAATAAAERIAEVLRTVDAYGDAADEAMRAPGAGSSVGLACARSRNGRRLFGGGASIPAPRRGGRVFNLGLAHGLDAPERRRGEPPQVLVRLRACVPLPRRGAGVAREFGPRERAFEVPGEVDEVGLHRSASGAKRSRCLALTG